MVISACYEFVLMNTVAQSDGVETSQLQGESVVILMLIEQVACKTGPTMNVQSKPHLGLYAKQSAGGETITHFKDRLFPPLDLTQRQVVYKKSLLSPLSQFQNLAFFIFLLLRLDCGLLEIISLLHKIKKVMDNEAIKKYIDK